VGLRNCPHPFGISLLLVVLEAVEQYLRSQSPKYGVVSLPSGLEVEHIMPRSWRTH
jgi:hypothetical protein